MRAIIQVDKQFSYSVGPQSFTINYKPAVNEGDSNSLHSIEINNMDISALREMLSKIGQALPSSERTKVGSRRIGHPQIKLTAKGTVGEEEPSPAE